MSSIAHQLANVLRWLREQVERAGAALFAEPDAQAARNGWTVTRRWGGLARTYRDPRFDQFSRCPDCGGSGNHGRRANGPCAECRGTGRVSSEFGSEPVWRRAS